MKRFGKAAALTLAVSMISAMASCGRKGFDAPASGPGSATQAAAENSGTKAASDLKAGICIYKFDNNFMTLYREELKNYLVSQYGIAENNITIMDGKEDQEVQNEQIDNFLAQGVDVLILNLVQASATESVADRCKDCLLYTSSCP